MLSARAVALTCASHATPTSGTPPKPPADHRQLGVQQDLFTTSIYSPGSPILLPNGARIFNRLVDFLRKQYVRYGFDEVITPTIYKKALWKKSGHLENYSDDMFTVTSTSPSRSDPTENGEEDEYGLKPMNCPGHCLIFASQRRSYRDLPIRYADFSPLHRNEISGALSGLTRVRRFHQDDGHIFCRPMQIEEEIRKTLDFVRVVYSTFKLGPYRLALSTRPADHFIGTPEDWNSAEEALKRALDASGQDWAINEGDGAFYGPKIDIILRDSDGKEHQTATIQLDFQLPKRFELSYLAPAPEFERRGEVTTDPDKLAESGPVTPVLIHRAVLGSVERLMALLIEHYDGKWPFWLNPKQVMILTVNDSEPVVALARSAQDVLMGKDAAAASPLTHPSQLTVDIDDSPRSLQRKAREARLKGYGVIVTVGPKQVASGSITVDTSGLASGVEPTRPQQQEMTPKNLLQWPLISAPTPSDPPLDYEASALGHGQPGPRPPQQQQTLPLRRPPPPPQIELPILQYLRTHRTILASASPRRRDLLAQLGLTNLEIIPSTKPENLSKKELGAYAYVSATAQQKALDVYASEIARVAADEEEEEEEEENEGEGEQENGGSRKRKSRKDPDLVISADTVIVTRDGTVLEKPPSEAAHRRMLRHLRDTRAHRVLTAVCAVAPRADAAHPGYALATHIEETRVYFARESDGLPDDVIDAYVRTREGADKAGGYAIQGLAGMLLVERVEGSVDNVVGLPVRKVLQVCEKVLFRQDEESDEEEDEDGFGNRDGE
ncbi:threonyl-tRNA synthetase-like protein [Xylariomycetidae sp. FL2044]|nr:threonyl-tRNA synthetase-like protein [Xylariomycetidae sp. FL2044]